MLARRIAVLTFVLAGAPASAQVITSQVAFRPYFGPETTITGGSVIPITNFVETNPDPAFPLYVATGQAQASGSFASGPVLRAATRLTGREVPHTAATFQPLPMRTNAVVTYADTPTVTTTGVPIGDPVTVTIVYSISGFFVNETPPSGPPLPATGGATMVQNSPAFNFGGFNGVFTSSFDVLNGTPYPYNLQLFVHATGPSNIPPGFPDTYSTAGFADYTNTVLLAGLNFADALGNPLSASMTSQSGFAYVAVPEPSAVVLAGSALSFFIARRAARRRS